MRKCCEDVSRCAPLNDLAIAHDCDAIGNLGNNAKIMGDEQDSSAMLALSSLIKCRICRLAMYDSTEIVRYAQNSCSLLLSDAACRPAKLSSRMKRAALRVGN
jgi:hypothetical protein